MNPSMKAEEYAKLDTFEADLISRYKQIEQALGQYIKKNPKAHKDRVREKRNELVSQLS